MPGTDRWNHIRSCHSLWIILVIQQTEKDFSDSLVQSRRFDVFAPLQTVSVVLTIQQDE